MAFEPDESRTSSAAPPTQPGMLPAAPATESWPTVIGIIAIIFGALGALGGLWGLVAPAVMRRSLANVPGVDQTSLDIMHNWQSWTVTASLLGAILAIVLLVFGIGLMGRKRWSRATGLTWAGLKMALVIATSVVASIIQRETFARMSQQSTSMPAMPVNMADTMAGFTLVFGLLWGWALPVFVLIWFSRRKIKDAVAAWA
jgi:hypothetical protein